MKCNLHDFLRLKVVSCNYEINNLLLQVFSKPNLTGLNNYLHEISYLEVKKSSNSAQEQCDQILDILKRNYLNTLVIETNGIGAFLPELFRLQAQIAGYPVAIKSTHSHKSKSERIVETLDPLLSSGFLKCHKNVKKSPLIDEIKSWFPEVKFAKDDGLDSVCGAIMSEPVRIRKMLKTTTIKKG